MSDLNLSFVNMLGDTLINYGNLNKLSRELQNKKFTVIDCDCDIKTYKKIQELFPNSVLDFVQDEGMYVNPK